MKRHAVMIIGGYYPYPSATGRCAEQNIQLIEEQYIVDVICLSGVNNDTYTYAGKQVYPVGNWYTHIQHKLRDKHRVLYMSVKLPVYILDLFRQPNNLHWYVKSAYRKLKEIHSIHPIDVVFSVGAPMAAHCAAVRFKKEFPEVRWVTYSVDSYAAQNSNKKKFCRFESAVLEKADFNLLSEEIYANSKFLYAGFSNKTGAIPYLLPQISVKTNNYFNNRKINCVYAGSFYKQIRNPEFVLNLFCSMPKEVVLHLFCTSDCDQEINTIIAQSNGRIVRHDPVTPEKIVQIYLSANILVSVGNSLPEFKPSKTFEYIATGKPILNIYYRGLQDDVLKQYPCVLQICNEETLGKALEQTLLFVRENANVNISLTKITSIYQKYSPENIRDILVRALNN